MSVLGQEVKGVRNDKARKRGLRIDRA